MGVHNLPAERRLNITSFPPFSRIILFLNLWNAELGYRAINNCIEVVGRNWGGEVGGGVERKVQVT